MNTTHSHAGDIIFIGALVNERRLSAPTERRNDVKEIKIRNKRYIRGMINNQIANAIRSREKGLHITTDPAVRAAVLKKTGGVCYICARRYTTKEKAERSPNTHFSELQIDHIVAFSKGGPNHMGNYLPICARCNNLKSDGTVGDAKLRLAKRRLK